jgi:hypothetical protein
MRAQLTEYYVLVETDDIDFSTLRLAVEELKTADSTEELPTDNTESD